MKNLLIGIVLLLAFTSCTKVIISEPVEKKAELTTFTITDNMKLYPPTEFVDGSLWEIIVYYYNKDVIIGFQEIDPILTGDKSKLINVPIDTDGLVYSFKLAPKKSIYYNNMNCRRYSEFVKIDAGINNEIVINDLLKINEIGVGL